MIALWFSPGKVLLGRSTRTAAPVATSSVRMSRSRSPSYTPTPLLHPGRQVPARVSHRVFVNGVSVAEGMSADSSSAGRVKGVFTLVSVPGISSGIHPPGASGVSAPGGAAAGSAVQHGGRMVIDIEHIAAPSTPPELVPMLEDPASNHHLTDLRRARLALHFAVGLAGRPSAEQEINSGVDMGDQHLGLTTAEWRSGHLSSSVAPHSPSRPTVDL